MKLIRFLLNYQRYKVFKSRLKLYKKIKSNELIKKYQLDRFNKLWEHAYSNFSIYKYWLERYNLPKKLTKLEELLSFPVLSKDELKLYLKAESNLFDSYKKIKTGGSSGNLLEFPFCKHDIRRAATSMAISRYYMGFSFASKYIMIWGHSHLLGTGLKKTINTLKRKIKDFFQGITRINAYDISEKSLDNSLLVIKKVKKSFIITYANYMRLLSQIDSFTKYLKKNKLKIILTGEVTEESDINKYKKFDNLEVYNEYGAAEAGLIAFSSNKSLSLRLLWDIWIAQILENKSLILTSLDLNSGFPLIRYEIGDCIEVSEKDYAQNPSHLIFGKVLGRNNDYILLPTMEGNFIKTNSVLYTHILKNFDFIKEFRIIQNKDFSITIEYRGKHDTKMENLAKKQLFEYLNVVLKQKFNLKIDFKNTENIKRTISGKIKFIERK